MDMGGGRTSMVDATEKPLRNYRHLQFYAAIVAPARPLAAYGYTYESQADAERIGGRGGAQVGRWAEIRSALASTGVKSAPKTPNFAALRDRRHRRRRRRPAAERW